MTYSFVAQQAEASGSHSNVSTTNAFILRILWFTTLHIPVHETRSTETQVQGNPTFIIIKFLFASNWSPSDRYRCSTKPAYYRLKTHFTHDIIIGEDAYIHGVSLHKVSQVKPLRKQYQHSRRLRSVRNLQADNVALHYTAVARISDTFIGLYRQQCNISIWMSSRSRKLESNGWISLLKTKHNLLYIRNQSVPHCKHYPPRL